MSSRSRPKSQSGSRSYKPIIDMSSVKPFSQPSSFGGGGSTAFTRTTAATSSSEESRSVARNSLRRGENIGRGGRSKSRPRDNYTNTNNPPPSPAMGRGRSHSRPRENTIHVRGRSMSIVRKEAQESSSSTSRNSRGSRCIAERGRSLGPLECGGVTRPRSRSSRGRVASTSSSSSSSNNNPSSSSRSKSNALRKSRGESMETMEEEREEDISDRNLVYPTNSHGHIIGSRSRNDYNNSHGRGRSLPRKRGTDAAIVTALSKQGDTNRGCSVSRHPEAKNAAAVAIAAALNEVNKSKQLGDKFSRHRGGEDGRRRQDTKTKSHSFHVVESDEKQYKDSSQHHHEDTNTRFAQFHRRGSRSVSPKRSTVVTTRCKSFHNSPIGEASIASDTSSTFSSYDRKIAKNFNQPISTRLRSTSTSNPKNKSSPEGQKVDACNALIDKDGCCRIHPFIQLNLKLPSGKWRTLSRSCVVCQEEMKKASPTRGEWLPHRRSSESGSGGGGTSSSHRSEITTSRRRPSERHEKNTRVSVAIMEFGESGECSLTPSVLEEDEVPGDDEEEEGSSRGSINSQVERKIRTSVASSRGTHVEHKTSPKAELPPLEVSIPQLKSSNEESFKSRHSFDASLRDSISSRQEQEDVKSVTSRRNYHTVEQDDAKSVKSTTSRRHYTMEQDDAKSVKSTTSRRQNEKKSNPAIDMSIVESVVETALQKIKSTDEFPKSTEAAPPTRSHPPPPPPPPPRSQSSKNLSSKAHAKQRLTGNNNGSNNGSSTSSSQRPSPPPPPPRPHLKTTGSVASGIDRMSPPPPKVPPPTDMVDYDCTSSMNVLNPEPEPEIQNDFGFDFDEMIPPFEQMEVSGMVGAPNGLPNGALTATNAQTKDWMKYCITSSAREGRDQKGERKSRIFGRNSAKNVHNERDVIRSVKQMPFTDQFGDFGLYTGHVNEDGRPDGKGSMKYENGVFYEGTWTNGGQDQKAAMQYERIRGGFTSWQGRGNARPKSGMILPWNARKNDACDPNEKTHVRGMEWTDLKGDSGRYTGEVNASELPHGHGIMRYDFGLIAEGEWNNGVLKENPQDRMMATVPAMGSGRSVGPGMSIGPGAEGFNAAASVMGSVMGGAVPLMGGGMPVGSAVYPMSYVGANPTMIGVQTHQGQYAMIAQQNAIIKGPMGMYGGGSIYGGGSVYGGGSMYGGSSYGQMPPPQMQGTPSQPGQPAVNGLPISEIKIN